MNKINLNIQSILGRLFCSNCRKENVRSFWCFILIFLLFFGGVAYKAPNVLAQYERIKPSQLKAVYIYNLINFINFTSRELPPETRNTVVAVLGNSPVNSALEELRTSLILEKRAYFDIVKYHNIENITDDNFEILFIDAELNDEFSKIIAHLKDRQVLTISDSEEFVRQGGIIGMVERQGRIRFKINQKMARQKGIKLSSQLLKTAIHVTQ